MEFYTRFVFLSVFLLCSSWSSVDGQVAAICRSNERFLPCGGCQKTCKDPAPQCQGLCRAGCYCPDDLVRNEDGLCINLADCPPSTIESKTSEPRPKGIICPENEEYRFCEPCNRTCDIPNPICPAQCARGCFCLPSLVRSPRGDCVPLNQCPTTNSSGVAGKQQNITNTQVTNISLTCDSNQEYRECETCERTCSDPKPTCPTPCVRGCFCKGDLVKAPDGKCIPLATCPQAELSIGGRESSIEECGSGEEFFECGWCESSCRQPAPQCGPTCTRGCLCRPPLLRHRSGRCVQPKDCSTQKCSDPNEQFTCQSGCETRCDRIPCPRRRPRRCILGCYCSSGFLRAANGRCVQPNQCPRPLD